MIRQVTARHESDPATEVEHKLRGSVEHRLDIRMELPCGGPVARGKQVVAADRHLVTGRRDGQSRELPTGLGLKVGGLVREVLSDRSGRCGPRRLGFERGLEASQSESPKAVHRALEVGYEPIPGRPLLLHGTRA